MANLALELEAGAATLAVTLWNGNQSTIETDVTILENALVAQLKKLLADIPAIKGLAGSVINPIEQAAEAAILTYVQGVIAKYGAPAIYAYLGSELAALAASATKAAAA